MLRPKCHKHVQFVPNKTSSWPRYCNDVLILNEVRKMAKSEIDTIKYHTIWETDKNTRKLHTKEPRGQPVPSR